MCIYFISGRKPTQQNTLPPPSPPAMLFQRARPPRFGIPSPRLNDDAMLSMIILQKSRQEHNNNRVCAAMLPLSTVVVCLVARDRMRWTGQPTEGRPIISWRRRPPLPSLRRLEGGGGQSRPSRKRLWGGGIHTSSLLLPHLLGGDFLVAGEFAAALCVALLL